MASYKDFEAANEKYVADFGEKGSLPLPPAKKVTRLTTSPHCVPMLSRYVMAHIN